MQMKSKKNCSIFVFCQLVLSIFVKPFFLKEQFVKCYTVSQNGTKHVSDVF